MNGTASTPANEKKQPALPLDWTRVRRRNDTASGSDQQHDCFDPACCPLPDESEDNNNNRILVYGTAIFCLPDPDCDWFQGHLLVDDGQYSYGLLCTANDDRVDACLKCDDYRLLDLSIQDFRRTPHATTYTIKNIVCRGGDAMRWNHPCASFQTEQLWTGTPAFEGVERYFKSLLRRLGNESVKECMPAVAVTKGVLQLWLPKNPSADTL